MLPYIFSFAETKGYLEGLVSFIVQFPKVSRRYPIISIDILLLGFLCTIDAALVNLQRLFFLRGVCH